MPLKITGKKPASVPAPKPAPKPASDKAPETPQKAPQTGVHLLASPKEHAALNGAERAFSPLCGAPSMEGGVSILSFNVTCPACLEGIEKLRAMPDAIAPRSYESKARTDARRTDARSGERAFTRPDSDGGGGGDPHDDF